MLEIIKTICTAIVIIEVVVIFGAAFFICCDNSEVKD